MLHVLHGRAVCYSLGPGELFKAAAYPYFCLGCQGPDIFYHNQRTRPSALEYGSLLHRRNYGDFSAELVRRAFAAKSTNPDKEKLLAFAAGFLLHAFLDRALHPYIISRTGGRMTDPDGLQPSPALSAPRLHMFLERIIDSIMVGRLDGITPRSWPQRSLLAYPAAQGSVLLVPLLAETLRSIFPERALKDSLLATRLEHAFTDAAFFYEATSPEPASANGLLRERILRLDHARGLAATAYLHPETVLEEADFCNFSHSPWLDPCWGGPPRTESVEDLYNKAVGEACYTLRPFWGRWGIGGNTSLAKAIGNGNLSLSGLDGKRCQAIHFSVLDVGKALRDEYETRKAQAL